MRLYIAAAIVCVGCVNQNPSTNESVSVQNRQRVSEKVIVKKFTPPFKRWTVNSYKFTEECEYETEAGSMKNWGKHLGEDCNAEPGTLVYPLAPGKVAYVGNHPGKNKDKRNWGGIVILGHWISETEALYTLYGHLDLNEQIERGQLVYRDDVLGAVAPPLTLQNGWWEKAHLHLQVCLDPKDVYRGGILKGYASSKPPNRVQDHIAPSELIRRFKEGVTIRELMQ